jgi:hypothetical protein
MTDLAIAGIATACALGLAALTWLCDRLAP